MRCAVGVILSQILHWICQGASCDEQDGTRVGCPLDRKVGAVMAGSDDTICPHCGGALSDLTAREARISELEHRVERYNELAAKDRADAAALLEKAQRIYDEAASK